MTPPPLEDRLEQIVAGIHAPPTGEARAAVGRRGRVLRRRRRALAAGSGALVVAAVVGAVAVAGGPGPDDTTTVADDARGELPAIVIDLGGWDVETAADVVPDAGAPGAGTVQTFRSPEGAAGPSVVLTHQGASDTLVSDPALDHEVTVGDAAGLLREGEDSGILLLLQYPGIDAVARIESSGLSRDEVLAFAGGLVARDDAISYPPEAGDTFGFDQTADIRGLVELNVPTDPSEQATGRHVIQSDGSALADLTIEPVDADGFETILDDLRSVGPAEDVTVMGRPATLVSGPEDLRWTVAWQPSDGAAARMVLQGVDRAGADAVIRALHTITQDEWDALVRDDH